MRTENKPYLKFFLILVLCLVVFSMQKQIFDFVIDDAFISFKYVQNFNQNNQLTYNLNEKVEGYSNFLWIILLIIFNKFNIDIILSSKILSLFFNFLSLFFLFNILEFISAKIFNINNYIYRYLISFSVSLIFLTNSFFLIWTFSGLETPLYVFLIILSFYLFLKKTYYKTNKKLFYIILFLITITRPEGIIYLFSYFIIDIILYKKDIKISGYLIPVLCVFVYLIFRYFYYSDILPNTYYAKMGGGLKKIKYGIIYLYYGLLNFISIPYYIILLPMIFFRFKNKKYFLIILFLIFINIFFIVFSGGDWMPLFRFFIPLILFIIILFYFSLFLIKNKILLNSILILFVLYSLIYNFKYYKFAKQYIHHLSQSIKDNKKIALYLKEKYKGEEIKMALVDAGALAYYSEFYIIDRIGLLDKHISRLKGSMFTKFDNDYLLNKKPDLIQLHIHNKIIKELNLKKEERFIKDIKFYKLEPGYYGKLYNYATWPGDKDLLKNKRFFNNYKFYFMYETKGNPLNLFFIKK